MKRKLLKIITICWSFALISQVTACSFQISFGNKTEDKPTNFEPKIYYVSIDSVLQAIKQFQEFLSVELINNELKTLKIKGIKNLVATPWMGNQRDVLVTITCLENYQIIEKIYVFRWYNIIAEPTLIELTTVLELTASLLEYNSLVELNFALEKIRIPGIRSMIAQLKDNSQTDVIVVIDTYVGYQMVDNIKTFTLSAKITIPTIKTEPLEEDLQNIRKFEKIFQEN